MNKGPTHDPVRFRGQCTGIGQSRAESERTGTNRAQRVVDSMPPRQRRFSVGYPKTTEEQMAAIMGAPVQTTLKRG